MGSCGNERVCVPSFRPSEARSPVPTPGTQQAPSPLVPCGPNHNTRPPIRRPAYAAHGVVEKQAPTAHVARGGVRVPKHAHNAIWGSGLGTAAMGCTRTARTSQRECFSEEFHSPGPGVEAPGADVRVNL